MSVWTHVAGIIRLDSLGAVILRGSPEEINRRVKEAIVKTLGQTSSLDSPSDQPCTVPTGSEGSLQYEVSHTGGEHELAWGHVSIWGDLRDFEEEDVVELKAWWERILTKLQPNPAMKTMAKIDSAIASFSIRDGVKAWIQ